MSWSLPPPSALDDGWCALANELAVNHAHFLLAHHYARPLPPGAGPPPHVAAAHFFHSQQQWNPQQHAYYFACVGQRLQAAAAQPMPPPLPHWQPPVPPHAHMPSVDYAPQEQMMQYYPPASDPSAGVSGGASGEGSGGIPAQAAERQDKQNGGCATVDMNEVAHAAASDIATVSADAGPDPGMHPAAAGMARRGRRSRRDRSNSGQPQPPQPVVKTEEASEADEQMPGTPDVAAAAAASSAAGPVPIPARVSPLPPPGRVAGAVLERPNAAGKRVSYILFKSFDEDDLHISAEQGIWATQPKNKALVNALFHGSDETWIFFSVNKSGAFQGVARMLGAIGAECADIEWLKPDGKTTWDSPFKVEWWSKRHTSVLFSGLPSDLLNPFNQQKPIRVGFDGTQVPYKEGERLRSFFQFEGAFKLAEERRRQHQMLASLPLRLSASASPAAALTAGKAIKLESQSQSAWSTPLAGLDGQPTAPPRMRFPGASHAALHQPAAAAAASGSPAPSAASPGLATARTEGGTHGGGTGDTQQEDEVM